jgi:hypothetical protein
MSSEDARFTLAKRLVAFLNEKDKPTKRKGITPEFFNKLRCGDRNFSRHRLLRLLVSIGLPDEERNELRVLVNVIAPEPTQKTWERRGYNSKRHRRLQMRKVQQLKKTLPRQLSR